MAVSAGGVLLLAEFTTGLDVGAAYVKNIWLGLSPAEGGFLLI